jgi:hypothetical protein
MTNVWPCGGANPTPNGGVDMNVPMKTYRTDTGDMLVMRGSTQDYWHHRVPQAKSRMPRLNLNFRYILPGAAAAAGAGSGAGSGAAAQSGSTVATEGQATYYKYMVYGDYQKEWMEGKLEGWSYEELLKKHGMLFFDKDRCLPLQRQKGEPAPAPAPAPAFIPAPLEPVTATKSKKRTIADMFASSTSTSTASTSSITTSSSSSSSSVIELV